MKTYFVYHVWGYDLYTPKDDVYHDIRDIEVIADNEKEAIKKAALKLKTRYYRVKGVYEKFIKL